MTPREAGAQLAATWPRITPAQAEAAARILATVEPVELALTG